MNLPNPIDPKVPAAALGAGGGAVVATFVLWVLSSYVFHGEVPPPVAALVTLVVSALFAWVAGFYKSTPTPVLADRLRANDKAGVYNITTLPPR